MEANINQYFSNRTYRYVFTREFEVYQSEIVVIVHYALIAQRQKRGTIEVCLLIKSGWRKKNRLELSFRKKKLETLIKRKKDVETVFGFS